MKRLIALLLTLVLALSAGLIPAWAAEVPSDPTAIANPNAVGYSAANVLAYPTTGDGIIDIMDYDSATYAATKAFVISSPEGLVKLSEIVNDTNEETKLQYPFTGKAIVFACDLDMTGKTMAPIGYEVYADENAGTYNVNTCTFFGTVYGNGYTISNLKIQAEGAASGQYYSVGLFGAVRETTIRDLKIARNCSFAGKSGATGTAISGGLMGVAKNKVNIYNCSVAGAEITGTQVGGFVGRQGGTVNIKNSTSSAYVVSSLEGGGFVGWSSALTVDHCVSVGKFNGQLAWIGGIIGRKGGDSVTISNCTVGLNSITSRYHAANLFAGGLIGKCDNVSATIENNKVYTLGTVTFSNTNHTSTTAATFVKDKTEISTGSASNSVPTLSNCQDLTKMQTIACQVSGDTTASSIRIVSSLDSIDYGDVRFQIEMKESGAASAQRKYNPQIIKVFESLVADGQVITPDADFGTGAKYYSTFVIDDIPSDKYDYNFRVRTYVTLADGSVIYGAWTDWFSVNSLNAKLSA